MTDKQMIIDGCEFQSYCIEYKDISYLKIMPICAIHELSIACHDKVNKCKYYKLYKQLKAKEQECEELKEKVKKYGEINEQETKDYAELKAENEELIRRITKIFACLIKANRTNKIVDTLWVDDITTLWDYIALILGIEGDQTQIEKQILQKIS